MKADFGKIDILVHSLANGPEVTKPLLETSRKVRGAEGRQAEGQAGKEPAEVAAGVLRRRQQREQDCSRGLTDLTILLLLVAAVCLTGSTPSLSPTPSLCVCASLVPAGLPGRQLRLGLLDGVAGAEVRAHHERGRRRPVPDLHRLGEGHPRIRWRHEQRQGERESKRTDHDDEEWQAGKAWRRRRHRQWTLVEADKEGGNEG